MTPDNALLTQTQQDAAIVALFAYLIRKGQERRARKTAQDAPGTANGEEVQHGTSNQ